MQAGAARLTVFRVFTLLTAIWSGSGVFQTIHSHRGWYADPVGWTRATVDPPGAINPWPILTVLVLVATLAALALFARWRGRGWRPALLAIGTTAAVLVATFAYFVPELMLMGGGTLGDPELIAHSRRWVVLNIVRNAIMLAVLWTALVALGRIGRADMGLAAG